MFFRLIFAFAIAILLSGCAATQWSNLHKQAKSLREKGQYDQALVVAKRSAEVAEERLGPDHTSLAVSLNDLAFTYQNLGQLSKAESLYMRALTINEKAFGSDHPKVALSLNNLALLYRAQAQYAQAESLYKRSLAINEKTFGQNHPRVALSLNNLAFLYQLLAQYAQAESLYKRSLVIYEKAFGPDHVDVAKVLNNLAVLYGTVGQKAKVESLYQRSLAINEKALGPNHLNVARSLNNLAFTYQNLGQLSKAESLYMRALTINEKAFGPDHANVALNLNNLAFLYWMQAQYAQAESLYKRSLANYEKTFGPDHPSVATPLINLTELYRIQGQYAQAEPLNKRALAINEKAFGSDHPRVANTLRNSSLNSWSLGDMAEALARMQRAIVIREHHLGLFLLRGSEEEKRAYMTTIADDPHLAISLQQAIGPVNLAATRLALTTLLQRKGRVLDAISGDIANLRERLNEQDRTLLDQLAAIRNQQSSLSNLALQGKMVSEYPNEMARLKAEAQTLEAKISIQSAEFKTKAQPITLAGIQQAVPKDAALVEFAVYRPFNPKAQQWADKWGAARYIVYVLRPQGEPLSIELGEAAAIDRRISELQKALTDPASNTVLHLARQLDEQLMRPVRKLLGKTRTVFLSPDGALNLLPFGALVDENNRYLIKDYAFTYLSSGRDLLRLQTKVQSQNPGVIIGDVDFGVAGNPIQTAAVDSGASNRRSSTFVSGVFGSLPGTGMEAREINKILPAAKVLMGKEATEGAIKKLNSPRILHVATHGFFLPDLQEMPDDLLKSQSSDGADRMPVTENPLLRSGLALANANRLESAGEDGVLTALEASGLNLWGTRLVVLSACETGLGDVQNGEGVFGLRRTLVIAGSESQIMTLWKVDDLATKDLMVGYYRRLVSKEGRSEALRQAQLAMLSDPKRQHPFYWASFIASGDWKPLD